MKRNITINLYGTLYNIDEDAYKMLDDYEKNMHQYYSRLPEGEEICDDIEHRIAELLCELKNEGINAININHVQDIISRIGEPDEIEDNDTQACSNYTDQQGNDNTYLGEKMTSKLFGKALYRDTNDKILGGVMSGLAKYFGSTDPTPFRIVLILLLFFSFSFAAIIYLILWALLPEANTAEDRLRMRGERVNAKTITEETVRNSTQSIAPRQTFGYTIFMIMGWVFKAILFAGSLITIFIFVSGMLTCGSLAIGISSFSTITSFPDAITDDYISLFRPFHLWLATLGFGLGLVWSGIAVFGTSRLLLNTKDTLPQRTRLSLTITAIIAFMLMVFSFAYCIGQGFGAAINASNNHYANVRLTISDEEEDNCALLEPGAAYQFRLTDENTAAQDSLSLYYYTKDDSTHIHIKLGETFTSTGGYIYWHCDKLPDDQDINVEKISM
ncbi:MAG: PspC domain-containing protein [Bacteroidaceae bacterium]|nr:PspC domain-containing protein [Bacteroidaceae bacterium]